MRGTPRETSAGAAVVPAVVLPVVPAVVPETVLVVLTRSA